jgi:xylulokinase
VVLLAGIDIGTTGTKVALVDPRRGVVADAALPVALESPAVGHAEADPQQWWANVCRLVPAVLESAGSSARDVAAVATTGMVPAVVAADEKGRPLRRAILQNDARAVAELAELAAETAHLDLVSLTGSPLSQQSVGPTLRWLSRHDPDIWRATATVLGSYDWMLVALGADAHVERNWAIESGLYDLAGGQLADVVALCDGAARLPPVAATATVVGEVSADAAVATGLRAGTPLVVGGADHVLSVAGGGLHEPGDLLIKLGGAGDIMLLTDRVVTDRRLYLDSYPVPGLWMPNGCMATSGSLIRWVQALVGGTALDILDAEADGCAAGEVLCLPYFLGEKTPLHDPDLRGAFVGLHLGHGRGALHRAVLEAIAFGFRHHLDVFAELGFSTARAWVTNGGSRSTTWKRIVADVIGLPLVPVLDHPGASLGAALAAGIGIGEIDGWAAAFAAVRYGEPIEPDPRLHDRYDDRYRLWRELGDAMTTTSHQLAARSRS